MCTRFLQIEIGGVKRREKARVNQLSILCGEENVSDLSYPDIGNRLGIGGRTPGIETRQARDRYPVQQSDSYARVFFLD